MSIHPSLSSSAKTKKVRSVLKRAERLKILMDKESWKQGQSIFALPKIKTIRIKIKKEKAAPAAAAETAGEGEAVPAEGAKETVKETAKETKSASTTEKPSKKPPSH
jgi:small basic protein (TIGR04137 family)